MELFLEGFPTHPKFNKKVSEHAFYNIHLPIVHHDPTALVKSGAGIIGERDVTRLCNLSVTLGNVQQKSCTLGGIASLNVTKKTHMDLTSLAFVELYRPAQMGDFLARARSPPNESTSSFNVAFMSPLLAPFFPAIRTYVT